MSSLSLSEVELERTDVFLLKRPQIGLMWCCFTDTLKSWTFVLSLKHGKNQVMSVFLRVYAVYSNGLFLEHITRSTHVLLRSLVPQSGPYKNLKAVHADTYTAFACFENVH
jgi:hypothetical protein